eukprot:CAMPEP_0202703800 /NCGR_PEP_ID=MMETSP1385-20130828/16604_1 /ASSEMBLY_ACC=CAM_ASM_000861 /TAXON_ID=933848 /ORGANISM="Elphidium margaritaceum" /LENGTH=125 /DNA_ID=CAMNT_0049361703 /DNA_START=200 /DNA_END=574 /DNA_ORIENTATION=-
MDILCSSCHPQVGTHEIKGICQDSCNVWYDACRNEYYFVNMYGQLTLCTDDALICAPLHTFIANGTEFCTASGFEPNYVTINCFDAHSKYRHRNVGGKTDTKLITDAAATDHDHECDDRIDSNSM